MTSALGIPEWLDEVEKKAKDATPWNPNDFTPANDAWHENRESNISFTRSCNPETVLQLIALVRELKAENQRMEEALNYISCMGRDDADFYSAEDVAAIAINMANTARAALDEVHAKEGEKK